MKEKRFAPQYLKATSVDRDTFTVRFIFSSARVDRHGEVIDQKGWKLENYMNNPVVLWAHDQSQFPIGKAANMSLESGNLEGDVIFAYKENPQAAIAFELAAGGFLSAGSVGFMNKKWMYDKPTDVLTLLENELFEFSIVNVPANPDAISKAVDSIKAKNMDKKFIDKVVELQNKAKEAQENRFKDLGEEVEEKVEVIADPAKPESGEDTDIAPEEVAEGVSTDEEVEKALEVLFKADREVIKASVKELASRLNDAQIETEEKDVDDASLVVYKKGLSNNHINFLVRSLLKSKD